MHIKESNQKHRSNKRKGFTLIEVLVALACSIIVIGTITGSLIFVNKINTQLIKTSSTLYRVKEIKHYILDNYKDGDDCRKVNDDIVYFIKDDTNGKVIFTDSNIDEVCIDTQDPDYKYTKNETDSNGNTISETYYKYTTCTIKYNQNGNKKYKFIVVANSINTKSN